MGWIALHQIEDVETDGTGDNRTVLSGFESESSLLDGRVNQVTAGEPTQFTAGEGIVLPGHRIEIITGLQQSIDTSWASDS